MVTWGPTTVFGGAAAGGGGATAPGTPAGAPATPGATGFSFGAPASGTAPAPGGGLFGTSAPATGGLFGSTTTTTSAAPSGGLFGGPAPAGGGGLFGSTTPAAAPITGGGLFGAPAPAGGGLFGSTTGGGGLFGSTSPAPSGGGLFGGSSTPTSGGGLFGTTTFGAPQQQQQQQQQQSQFPQQQGPVMDARDVYQAFLANNARKEEIRITEAMRNIYEIYTGTKQQQNQQQLLRSGDGTLSVPFSTILYNPATGQQRQLMAVHAAGGTGGGNANAAMVAASIVEKPIQISQSDWNEAIVKNPDIMNYVPIGIVGADSLQARVLWHQEQVDLIAKHMESIEITHTTLRQRYNTAVRIYENQKYNHTRQRIRLLDLMKKVELLRCWNQPLQIAELEAATKLRTMKQQLDHIRHAITSVQSLAASRNNDATSSSSYNQQPLLQLTYDGSDDNNDNAIVVSSTVPSYVPDQTKLLEIVKQHRSQLTKYTMDLKKDKHDLQLIEQRVRSQTPVPATFRS